MPLGFDGVVEANRVVRASGCETAAYGASRWIERHVKGVKSAVVKFHQQGFSVAAETDSGSEVLEYTVKAGKGRVKHVNGGIKERAATAVEQRYMEHMRHIGLMVNRTYVFSSRAPVTTV